LGIGDGFGYCWLLTSSFPNFIRYVSLSHTHTHTHRERERERERESEREFIAKPFNKSQEIVDEIIWTYTSCHLGNTIMDGT